MGLKTNVSVLKTNNRKGYYECLGVIHYKPSMDQVWHAPFLLHV